MADEKPRESTQNIINPPSSEDEALRYLAKVLVASYLNQRRYAKKR